MDVTEKKTKAMKKSGGTDLVERHFGRLTNEERRDPARAEKALRAVRAELPAPVVCPFCGGVGRLNRKGQKR